MGVRSAATTRTSRNRIGACTHGPASRADSAVSVIRGRHPLFIPWLARLVGLPDRRVAANGSPGERKKEVSYATLSLNQPPAKFKAKRRFRGRYIGSSEFLVYKLLVLINTIVFNIGSIT